MPPFALVPAYLSQLPTSKSVAVVMIAGLGPPLFKIQMTMLTSRSVIGMLGPGSFRFFVSQEVMPTYGLIPQKAKRYPVLIQFMALSETSKYSAAVVEMDEKVNHCIQNVSDMQIDVWIGGAHTSQLTMIFNNTSWANPQKRRL